MNLTNSSILQPAPGPARRSIRTGSFLAQSFVVVVANVVAAGLSVGFVSMVSRSLGPAEYSNVTAAVSLGNIFLFLLGPLNGTIIKFAARYYRDNDRSALAGLAFGSLRGLGVPLGVAVAVVWLASPLIQRVLRFDSVGVLLALALFAALSILVAVPRCVLSGEQRFGAYGVNQIAEAALRLVGGIAVVLLGLQAPGAMAAYTAGIAGAFVLALFQVRSLMRVPQTPLETRALFSFSVPVIFVYTYFVFTTNTDMLVVKGTLAGTDAGLYGAASSLAKLLLIAATPIYLVLFSRVSALRATREGHRLAMQVLAVMAVGLALSFALPWLVGDLMLQILFGGAYVGAVSLLRILWITTSLLILQVAASHYLLAIERLPAAWAYVAPCALMAILLWQFHASTVEVALCSLAAITGGFVLTAIFVWIAPEERDTADPGYPGYQTVSSTTLR